MDYSIADIKRASEGVKRIDWADRDMPVLAQIRERFAKTKPFKGVKVAACLQVTAETANFMRTLKTGGAEVSLCASNPLTTRDEIAAALVKNHGIAVYAKQGVNAAGYYRHIEAVVARQPSLIFDDGGDLTAAIVSRHPGLHDGMIGALEGTTTGVARLRAMERDGVLPFPVVAVNDAETKRLFDNRFGTGQSVLDGIVRAANILVAGLTFVVAGYGWCGRGLAARVRGLGGRVIVTEVDEMRALRAAMDGYDVLPMADAAKHGDVFCVATGDRDVIRPEHVRVMKDGAILANAGHFDVEIDMAGLRRIAKKTVRTVRGSDMTEYVVTASKSVYVLAEGRLVNFGCAEGQPTGVMDMTYALQALSAEWCLRSRGDLARSVHLPPASIDRMVAGLKLKVMGIQHDTLTPTQKKYLSGWEAGT